MKTSKWKRGLLDPEPTTPHAKLRRRRLVLGMSQEELAAKVGVSQNLISQIELGRVPPERLQQISANGVKKLAEALEIAPDYLLQWLLDIDPAAK